MLSGLIYSRSQGRTISSQRVQGSGTIDRVKLDIAEDDIPLLVRALEHYGGLSGGRQAPR